MSSSANEYQSSFFILNESAPRDLKAALSRLMGEERLSYQCKIVDSGHPYYLHIEVQMGDGHELRGTLLIPHQYVLLAGTNFVDKTLGFVRGEG